MTTHGSFRRGAALLLAVLLLLPLASACGAPPDPEAAMREFCRLADLPAGRIGVLWRESPEDGVSEALLAALFAEDGGVPALENRPPACLFLSFSRESPAEAGIFACRTRDEAEAVCRTCLLRVDRLRRAFPADPALLGAGVRRYGNAVVYCVLPQNDAAFRIWDGIL